MISNKDMIIKNGKQNMSSCMLIIVLFDADHCSIWEEENLEGLDFLYLK